MTLLVKKEANPNIVIPEYGVAPIHLAVGTEDINFGCEATKLFLRHGGDPNVRFVLNSYLGVSNPHSSVHSTFCCKQAFNLRYYEIWAYRYKVQDYMSFKDAR